MFPPELKMQLSKGLHTILKIVEIFIFRIRIISRLLEFAWKLFGSNQYYGKCFQGWFNSDVLYFIQSDE